MGFGCSDVAKRGGAVRRVIALILLPAFGILLAFVPIEVAVRVLHLVPDRFWEWDPLLGTRLIANKEGWWTQEEGEFKVRVRINSRGLRDVEHAAEKPPGVRRVLVLGDSFMEAMQVPLEATFARRLEQRLNADGRRVEVINAGVSGYGTAGEYLWFREYGRDYRPDLVLLAFYPGNDVKNNSPELESALKPEYDRGGELVRVVAPVRQGRRGLFGWSAAVRYLRKLIVTRHAGLADQLARVGLVEAGAAQAPQRDGVPLDYGVYRVDAGPEWERAWQKTSLLLKGLHDDATRQGASFAILIVTARERIYPDTWKEICETNPRMKSIDWNLDAPERRIAEWCAANQVPCVPLTATFKAESSRDGEPLHYRYDGHWTARGHELAAATVAAILEKELDQP